ncbi:MAG: hypothetical protein H0W29_12990 [Gemmatimonadales bacterium]|nr:hypothetical protein [Gemmatimonadales bacterium]
MRPAERSHRLTAGVLLLFAVLFTFLMSIGGKKFDRYLLPVYAPLDLVAAMGWLAAMTWLKNRAHQFGRLGAASLGGVAVAGQFATAIPAFPYYFSYYNPLLGGTAKAPGVMMVGWGEGLDQAARYLNALPGADRLRVSTWFWNGTFSYFFRGPSLPGRFTPDSAALRQWLSTDYCVLYINQRQRGRLPRELVDYVAGLKPVRVVRIQGLEYAQIYHVRASPIPAYLTGERSSRPAGE